MKKPGLAFHPPPVERRVMVFITEQMMLTSSSTPDSQPHPPDWRKNLPRVMGKGKGRVGLEPRVSLWHTHCGLREHQPCLSQCPDPLPAHSLSLFLDHFLGQRAEAVSSTVFGCGVPRCFQGLDLCTPAQGQAPVSALRRFL